MRDLRSTGPGPSRRDFLGALACGGLATWAGCGGNSSFHPVAPHLDWPRWPDGMRPAECPIYLRNEILISGSGPAPVPASLVFQWLCRADLWPQWFRRASKVRIEAGRPALTLGSVVVWHMLGATIRVKVTRYEPPFILEWEGGDSGAHAYHAWLLQEADGGTRVITDETERGPVPSLLRLYLRGALRRAHQDWIEGLARVVASGEPPPAPLTTGGA